MNSFKIDPEGASGDVRQAAGRFTLLMSPTLLTFSFLLLAVICERQNRQWDIQVIHPSLAGGLVPWFNLAANVAAIGAGAVAIWLAFRGKTWGDIVAAVLQGLVGLCGLLGLFVVHY